MNKYEIVNDQGNGIYEVQAEGSDIHYYVNEPKGTVVAVMDNCRRKAVYELGKKIDKYIGTTWDFDVVFDLPQLKDTYKGKARCIGGDTFNLEIGMKNAREHMLAKYYEDYCIAYTLACERVNDLYENMVFIQHNLFNRFKKFSDLSATNWAKATLYKVESEIVDES